MFFSYYFNHVNWLAVLVSTLAYFIVGALWFSPVLFAKKWQALHKVEMTEESRKRIPVTMAVTLVLAFIIVMGLSMVVMQFHPVHVIGGIKVGLLTSGCFMFTVLAMTHMYTMKPIVLWFIDAGYHIVASVIAAVILTMWR